MNFYELLFYKYIRDVESTPKLDVKINVFKDGTEQLLPTNSSTPTTTPLLADIKYPDELRTNQYFTYRESPTTQDGIAKLNSIKGNSAVFNQLNKDNFTDLTEWYQPNGQFGTLSISNNVLTSTITSTPNGSYAIAQKNPPTFVEGHKYLFFCDVMPSKQTRVRFQYPDIADDTFTTTLDANVWTKYISVITMKQTIARSNFYVNTQSNLDIDDTVQIKNWCLVDLTLLNDTRITDYNSFKTYYPLDYYDYNVGTLLSFNGTELVSTGKNILNFNRTQGTLTTGSPNKRSFEFDKYYVGLTANNYYSPSNVTVSNYSDDSMTVTTTSNGYGVGFPIRVLPNTQYDISWVQSSKSMIGLGFYENDGTFISYSRTSLTGELAITTPNNCFIMTIVLRPDGVGSTGIYTNVQLELGDTATTYEPYTENTLSLPISTYFPTGMKSAGNVYDELTKTQAKQRIGVVDLGSLNWTYNSAYGMYTSGIQQLAKYPPTIYEDSNLLCPIRQTAQWNDVVNGGTESGLCGITQTGLFGMSTTETNPTSFKTSLSGVYLFYELNSEVVSPIIPATNDSVPSMSSSPNMVVNDIYELENEIEDAEIPEETIEENPIEETIDEPTEEIEEDPTEEPVEEPTEEITEEEPTEEVNELAEEANEPTEEVDEPIEEVEPLDGESEYVEPDNNEIDDNTEVTDE